jgi:hypothetical protein
MRRALAAVLTCAGVLAAPALRAGERDVDLTLNDGTALRGVLIQTSPALVVRGESGETAVAWSELFSLSVLAERPPAPLPQRPGLRWLDLSDGTSVLAELDDAGERSLDARLLRGHAARVELSSLRAIRGIDLSPSAHRALEQALRERDPADDRVVVAHEGRVLTLRGELLGVTARQVTIRWNGRDTRLPWERLAGVVMGGALPRSAACRVTLDTGERLAGRPVGGDTDRLELDTPWLGMLSVPWDAVQRIECRSERVVMLPELPPVAYEFDPLFGKRWPLVLDHTFSGADIRLGGVRYRSGVCMHSQSRVTYRLAGAFRQFAAVVGVLDEMGARGNVDLRIVGDGRTLWEERGVRGGQPPRAVSVDVTGVFELMLVVDWGEDLDLSDQVAWAQARLVR